MNDLTMDLEKTAGTDASAAADGRHDSELSRVYHAVLAAIMDRELLPGKKLTESDLCRQMVCSRNTVRGALSLLAHDRIVDLLPNRGAFVHVPDLKEIRDVFAMRMALEEMVLDMLSDLPDLAERLQPIYRLIDRQGEADVSGDSVERERLANAFHIELARVLGNDVLVDMMSSLCARSSLMVALIGKYAKQDTNHNEHLEMLELLEEGRRNRVCKVMRRHLGGVLVRLERQFEEL